MVEIWRHLSMTSGVLEATDFLLIHALILKNYWNAWWQGRYLVESSLTKDQY